MSWQTGVFHNPSGIYMEGQPRLNESLTLRLRVPLSAPVDGVFLRCAPDGEQQMFPARRQRQLDGWNCVWWEVNVDLSNRNFQYRFFLLGKEGGHWYNAVGVTRHLPTDHFDFHVIADHRRPSWLDSSVFYQIFPDRFAMGNASHRVRAGGHKVDGYPAVTRNWGELPKSSQGGREFYGGDLEGITQHLDHLQETLGINALYLNPVGTAPSNHKYDVASYHEVDPHLGGQAAFVELRERSRERGMRIILDIVPNHCGSQHPWFVEAQRNPNAETAEFFNFHRHPDQYESWMGHASLPKLNYQSQKLREWMYSGPDSVMRHWLKAPLSIDGWRIDVANMLARQGVNQLGHKILRGMRRAVKAENPDCYLLGENFFDASLYLQGDELDATMNYRGFMMPLYHWLTGRDYNSVFGRSWADNFPLATLDLALQWRSYRATIPWAFNRQQFNLLDSHDTPRLLNLVGGDRKLAAIARLILFTYPGVPCVYYGDEIALEGDRDPDNRRTMNWNQDSWDRDWLDGWSRLIRLRTSSETLIHGSLQVVSSDGDTLAFVRETATLRTLVVARRRDDGSTSVSLEDAAVADGTRFREVMLGLESTVNQGRLEISGGPTQIWEQMEAGTSF